MSHGGGYVGLAARLAGRTPHQLAEFFTATSALEFTDLLRHADDAELRPLVGDPEVRGPSVPGILHRFGEFADPDRLVLLCGVARFELAAPGGKDEPHVVRFSPAGVELLAAAPVASGAGRCRAGRRGTVG